MFNELGEPGRRDSVLWTPPWRRLEEENKGPGGSEGPRASQTNESRWAQLSLDGQMAPPAWTGQGSLPGGLAGEGGLASLRGRALGFSEADGRLRSKSLLSEPWFPLSNVRTTPWWTCRDEAVRECGRGSQCGACADRAPGLGLLPFPPPGPFVSTISGRAGETLHTPKRLSPGDFTTVLAEFQMFRVVRRRSGRYWCRSWGWTGPGARMGLQEAGARARLGLWSRQGAGDLIGRNLWV